MARGVFLTAVMILFVNGSAGLSIQNEEVWEAILYGYVVDPDAPEYLSRGDVIFEVPDTDQFIAISSEAEMDAEFQYSDSESTAAQEYAVSVSVEGYYGAFSAAASMEVSQTSETNIKTVRMDSVIKAIKYSVASKNGFRTFPEQYLTDNFKDAVTRLSCEDIEQLIGSFYATNLKLGGEVRKTYTMQAMETDDVSSITAELQASYGTDLMGVTAEVSVGITTRESNSNAEMSLAWSAKGGDPTVWLGHDFSGTDSTSVTEIQSEWDDTITDENLYPFDFQLGMMWDLIKAVDYDKGVEYQQYLEAKWEVQANSFNPTTFMEPDEMHVEKFRIKVSDRSYAYTSGKLRIGVRQGNDGDYTFDVTSCETIRATFVSPDRNQEYIVSDTNKFNSCRYTKFNPNEEIQIQILSDSGDDSYLDEAGIMIDGEWKNWIGWQEKINKHGEGSEWRVVH